MHCSVPDNETSLSFTISDISLALNLHCNVVECIALKYSALLSNSFKYTQYIKIWCIILKYRIHKYSVFGTILLYTIIHTIIDCKHYFTILNCVMHYNILFYYTEPCCIILYIIVLYLFYYISSVIYYFVIYNTGYNIIWTVWYCNIYFTSLILLCSNQCTIL